MPYCMRRTCKQGKPVGVDFRPPHCMLRTCRVRFSVVAYEPYLRHWMLDLSKTMHPHAKIINQCHEHFCFLSIFQVDRAILNQTEFRPFLLCYANNTRGNIMANSDPKHTRCKHDMKERVKSRLTNSSCAVAAGAPENQAQVA